MSMQAPYPATVRAKGWRFELDHERIEASATWALAPAELRPWLLMLWMTSWKQTPCGSLDSDDAVIAARIGMPARMWAKHRAVLMRGWVKADDGRLYHATVTELVIEMMERRRSESDRKAAQRARQAPESNGSPADVPRDNTVTPAESDTDHRPPNTNKDRENPLPLSGRECGYCGVEQASVAWAFEWDHFVPKSAGGSDDESNRVWSCHCCNQIKGGRIFTSVKAAAEYIHTALWAKNRARYEEPRRVCFGGKPPASFASSVQAFPPGFEAFWVAYPRKVAKDHAAKAYARLKPDEPLQRRILAALAAQVASEQWTRDGGRFVPHAATWLNGRRWEDEGESPSGGGDIFAGAR